MPKDGDEFLKQWENRRALRQSVVNSEALECLCLPRSDYHDSGLGELGGTRQQAIDILTGEHESRELDQSFWMWRFYQCHELWTFAENYS